MTTPFGRDYRNATLFVLRLTAYVSTRPRAGFFHDLELKSVTNAQRLKALMALIDEVEAGRLMALILAKPLDPA